MLAYRNNPQDDESGGPIPAETARPPQIPSPAGCGKIVAESGRAELARDVEQTIDHWRANALSPREVWHQLTGQHRRHVTWRQVKHLMVDPERERATRRPHMD